MVLRYLLFFIGISFCSQGAEHILRIATDDLKTAAIEAFKIDIDAQKTVSEDSRLAPIFNRGSIGASCLALGCRFQYYPAVQVGDPNNPHRVIRSGRVNFMINSPDRTIFMVMRVEALCDHQLFCSTLKLKDPKIIISN